MAYTYTEPQLMPAWAELQLAWSKKYGRRIEVRFFSEHHALVPDPMHFRLHFDVRTHALMGDMLKVVELVNGSVSMVHDGIIEFIEHALDVALDPSVVEDAGG